MAHITIVDTSVLCELLRVPSKAQDPDNFQSEFDERRARGELFLIPATTVIETGNHICQAPPADRRGAAQRLVKLLQSVAMASEPFMTNRLAWDGSFVEQLCAGDTTGQTLVDLLGNRLMGAGDVALLVERDRFRQSMDAHWTIEVWTKEATMKALA